MESKKLLPVVLIGAGAAVGLFALLGNKSNANNTNTYVPQNYANGGGWWANFSAALTNALAVIAGGINTISDATKATGSFASTIGVVTTSGYKTGIVSTTVVKNLKAGNKISITSAAFSGVYTVLMMGNSIGQMTDTLIVIDKPFVISAASNGTYTEQ
jgi:hypothetical protein